MYKKKKVHSIMANICVYSFLFFLLSCSSGTLRQSQFDTRNTHKGTSSKSTLSKDTIDNEKTYEVYFRIKKAVDCIKINIHSSTLPNKLTKKTKVLKSYFVIDKAIDISHFNRASGSEKKVYAFTKITANFDDKWSRKRDIVICSSPEDLLKKLDSSSLFRLRFSVLLRQNFNYTINIRADGPVEYKTGE
ncbi:MAG: hypothetical protein GY754_36710 [bacterium]|nr:hypothetical protein [bacterium]